MTQEMNPADFDNMAKMLGGKENMANDAK